MSSRILYCHCAYAKVVPADVKAAVLDGLSEAGVEFDAVPDLCELAAHDGDSLRELAGGGPLRIAACYPRAVRWLFASAQAPLPDEGVRIWNMRLEQAGQVVDGLLGPAEAGPHVGTPLGAGFSRTTPEESGVEARVGSGFSRTSDSGFSGTPTEDPPR